LVWQEAPMSGIGAVTPPKTQLPVEGQQPPDRDGGKRSPPRKPKSDDDLVAAEQHKLDVEA
jgi:hypothetical protein